MALGATLTSSAFLERKRPILSTGWGFLRTQSPAAFSWAVSYLRLDHVLHGVCMGGQESTGPIVGQTQYLDHLSMHQEWAIR